jgi:hypothetical protein
MGGLRRYWTIGLPLTGLLASGCAEELGPERKETTRVVGVVREGRRPIGRGWVEFVPADGTVGNLRSAPLRPDGSFIADGVAVGVNRIGLTGAPLESPGGRNVFNPLTSQVRREIPRTPSGPLTIDVLEEVRLDAVAKASRGVR